MCEVIGRRATTGERDRKHIWGGAPRWRSMLFIHLRGAHRGFPRDRRGLRAASARLIAKGLPSSSPPPPPRGARVLYLVRQRRPGLQSREGKALRAGGPNCIRPARRTFSTLDLAFKAVAAALTSAKGVQGRNTIPSFLFSGSNKRRSAWGRALRGIRSPREGWDKVLGNLET